MVLLPCIVMVWVSYGRCEKLFKVSGRKLMVRIFFWSLCLVVHEKLGLVGWWGTTSPNAAGVPYSPQRER